MMIIPYRNLKIFLFKIITQKVKDFIPLLNYFYGHKNKTSFSDFNEDNTENIVNVPSNLRIGFYKISVRYKGSKPSNPSSIGFKPPYLSPRNNINPRTLRNNQGANNQNRTSGDHQPINNTNTATRYPVNSNNNSSKFKSIRDEYENLPNQAANTNTEKNPINNKLDYLKQDSNNNNDLATLIAKKTITNTTSSFVFPKTTTPPLLLPPPAPIQPLLIATTPTPIEEVVTTQEPPNIPETIVLVTITPEFPVSIIQEVSNTNIPVPPPLPAKLLSPNQSTIVSGHIEIKNAVATFNENNNNVNDTILIEKRKQEIQLLEKKQEEIRKESLKELFKASQLEKKKYLILEQKHWTEDKVNFLKEINDFSDQDYAELNLYFYERISTVIDLKLFLHFNDIVEKNTYIKIIRLIILVAYLISWSYILIVSFHTLQGVPITMEIIKILEEYSQISNPFL